MHIQLSDYHMSHNMSKIPTSRMQPDCLITSDSKYLFVDTLRYTCKSAFTWFLDLNSYVKGDNGIQKQGSWDKSILQRWNE